MTTITHLTCEYRTDPLGIDVPHPRLGWQMESDRCGARQTAYQILAAPSITRLEAGAGLSWDSGRITSDQTIHVPYNGPALASGQRLFWKVRVWDETGEASDSHSAWWEMGLLEQSDWKAHWIGAPFFGGPRTSSPAPFLRRELTIQKQVVSARLYATALGLYECHLNGERVGKALFTPGWTDYSRHIQYQVYDVTNLLRTGPNAVGAILGDGWGVGNIAWMGRQHYADQPQFLAQIVINYADGSREIISTGEGWKVTQGPILESDTLMGESYDARREMEAWFLPGFNDAAWWPVEIFPDREAALVATNGPIVKSQDVLSPLSIKKVPNLSKPRWVFDFGQNMVGWVRLTVQGQRGMTITLRFAEALNPDGSLYTTNLRTARSTDHYTLKGDGEETWEPRFTFHGFRYVEISGLSYTPGESTLTGMVIHSDIPPTGSFECSDPLINQLQHNILWGLKGNFIDIPTDCPQRDERLGWTGDAQVFVRTAAFNRQVAGFFTKWARDLEDSQYPNGEYPNVAPDLASWTIGEGGPAWSDAGVICPWTIYQCYGDVHILREHYPSMQRFIEFLRRTSREGLRCFADYTGVHGHGDWLALDGSDGREGGTSKELIGTAFYAYSAGLVAKIAHLLGREQDAVQYQGLADEARGAFNTRFVHPDGTIEGGTQTSYVLALEFDLLPETLRPLAAAELVRSIQSRGDHLSTGFVGTPYINWVLTRTGHLDTAYALLKQTSWPSWLYSVTQGATTIWERWDGWTHDKGFQDPKMNSFNHYAYGAIGAWLYAVVGGIDLDPSRPGYKHILMHPRPGGGLTSATAKLNSMYGTVHSSWTLEKGRFDWTVIIPPNTTATLYIPTREQTLVLESEAAWEHASGLTFLRMEDGCAVFHAVSGFYRFTSEISI